MADARATVPDAEAGAGSRTGPGFELRLERGGAHVRLAAAAAAGGLTAEGLDLEVPDVSMPFDVGAGPGQFQNRLSYAISLAQSQIVNTKAAESRIRDANIAEESASLTRYSILNQSGIAALAQANQSTSAVLSLLRG
jgi:hypothetical protein